MALSLDVGGEFFEISERAVEQIGPNRLARCVRRSSLRKRLGVQPRVQRRQRDPSPFERDPLRPLGRMSIDQWTDGPGCWRVVISSDPTARQFHLSSLRGRSA